MATTRLPLRVRAALALLAVVAVVVVGGATAAVQYGASALDVGDGSEISARATERTWFGLEVENPSSAPVTLRSVRAVGGSNARIVATRVVDHAVAGGGIGAMSPPLPAEEQSVVDGAARVDGFVVPAHSRSAFQIIVLVERIRPGDAAVIRSTDIGFSALGLDHGVRSRTVVCIRAPGAVDCPRGRQALAARSPHR